MNLLKPELIRLILYPDSEKVTNVGLPCVSIHLDVSRFLGLCPGVSVQESWSIKNVTHYQSIICNYIKEESEFIQKTKESNKYDRQRSHRRHEREIVKTREY